jgi:dipeptidyl aminopeptidase/acylaminoacyl peptidase
MSMSYPNELYRVDLTTGKQEQLTFINKKLLDPIAMGDVKKRMVKTTDGKDMLVWMIYPPNFDPNKKYPTLLYCQGGPQSAVSQFWSYRWNFQLMAANDYIVVAPNRRGLPSFGQEWNDEISGDWGGQAMEDYLSAIDDAAKEPYVNADKLGAVGASFGGYSVYWLAGNHNKRFKTFIAHCGVFNLESMYGTTEEMFFVNWDLGGPYWNPALKGEYLQHSPHKYVQNWDTPIMVIHGENDFRVPIGEGMQAFQAAQLKGIPSKFLYFPDEGHWVMKPQNALMWQREFFSWLDEYLKPGGRS